MYCMCIVLYTHQCHICKPYMCMSYIRVYIYIYMYELIVTFRYWFTSETKTAIALIVFPNSKSFEDHSRVYSQFLLYFQTRLQLISPCLFTTCPANGGRVTKVNFNLASVYDFSDYATGLKSSAACSQQM